MGSIRRKVYIQGQTACQAEAPWIEIEMSQDSPVSIALSVDGITRRISVDPREFRDAIDSLFYQGECCDD